MKRLVCSLLIFFISMYVCGQDGPDQIVGHNGKATRVFIVKEDCNNVYFKFQKGGTTNKKPWTKVLKVVYSRVSRKMENAESDYDAGSLKVAIRNYGKVLSDNSTRKWEKNKATYRIGLSELRRGNATKAKKSFSTIKKDSRWFYPSILQNIKTLPANEKIRAMEELVRNGVVSGPFLGKLLIMLLERQIAEGLSREAAITLAKIKGLRDAPSKTKLNDLDIKLDVLNKKFSAAKSKIKTFIDQQKDTGTMRIAMGTIYMNEKKLEDALYEFLRARISFHDVKPEAAFNAGNTFLKLYYTDNVKLKKYKTYAKKELSIAASSNDGLWSVKARKLLAQLK